MDKRLQILIDRHQLLDDMADTLSEKRYLSPRDQMDLKRLKLMRLRAREAMDKLALEECSLWKK